MKTITTILLVGSVALGGSACGGNSRQDPARALSTTRPETYRPQFHFTPERNWMNDPNGLVYHEGEYHLFYQFEPDHLFLWAMHWGHAVSRDLVRWDPLPVALSPDPTLGLAFSGSAVVDEGDTSGLCEGGDCLIAVLTHHGGRDRTEKQSLAFSRDSGRAWTLFSENPVLPNPGKKPDFRDPKVFWHAPTASWVMVLAAGDHAEIYGSSDLRSWEHLSDFGPAGAPVGTWECPELVELPVEDPEGESRWVLVVSLNPGLFRGPSGVWYFPGSFDGTGFAPDRPEPRRADFGADFYAAQSWSGAPGGRRAWIAWMSNWQYAFFAPTYPWRGAMTVPRDLVLRREDGGSGWELVQRPVPELASLRKRRLLSAWDRALDGESIQLGTAEGDCLEVLAEIEIGGAREVGFRLRVGETEETLVGYSANDQALFLDRSHSGRDDFHRGFATRHTAPLNLPSGERLDLRILVDRSSIEVFAAGGRAVISDLVFPDPESRGLGAFALDGPAILRRLEIFELESIWVVR